MKRTWWSDSSQSNWVDYALGWLAACLAVFSAGQAVYSNAVSFVGLLLVSIGTLISYGIRTIFANRKWLKFDGILYCILTWIAIIGVRGLTVSVFGPDTFPRELLPSSWLYWMIIFGCAFQWRDGTLIFHLIPALAMFGFVGCYDTFAGVVFLFFIFLICFAILFARAHARDMQVRAIESGFFGPETHKKQPTLEQSQELYEGPWRWAAGAEWALGSALVIVVLSLIGAPVIQETAKPVSGLVRVAAPRFSNRASSTILPNTDQSSSAPIGSGPVNLRNIPVFEVRGSVPSYLRVLAYSDWTGSRWLDRRLIPAEGLDRVTGESLTDIRDAELRAINEPNRERNQSSEEYRTNTLQINALMTTREVPQSGNSPRPIFNAGFENSSGGLFSLTFAQKYRGSVVYDSMKLWSQSANSPRRLAPMLVNYINTENADPRLIDLAKEVTKDSKTDAERMMMITREVARRIKYNTQVPPTPVGKDPAGYAVFESKQGYCDVFATAVVQMARALKIPTRYVVGYAVDPIQINSSGTQYLLESDRHAWAEAFFEGIGWVVFDATVGAEVVPGGDRRNGEATGKINWLSILKAALIPLSAVILAIGGFLYWRAKPASKPIDRYSAELDQAYLFFTSALWKQTGKRRLLSETTKEYTERVSSLIGPLGKTAKSIGRDFTEIQYGLRPIQAEKLSQLKSDVSAFVKELKQLPK